MDSQATPVPQGHSVILRPHILSEHIIRTGVERQAKNKDRRTMYNATIFSVVFLFLADKIKTAHSFLCTAVPERNTKDGLLSSVHRPFGWKKQHLAILLASNEYYGDDVEIRVPSEVRQPVLRQVYPALVAHAKEYGHPNIPLGSSEGRKCSTLRRLKMQNKLTDEEIGLLEDMGFRFISFDNIYYEADFDTMLNRLLEYEETHKANFQIPKKYAPDVELGAWVTMIRRLGQQKLSPEHVETLNKVNFAWKSTRKCGSSFMKNYRELKQCLEDQISNVSAFEEVEGKWAQNYHVRAKEVDQLLSADPKLKRWLVAQKDAWLKGNLSDERVKYLDELTEQFGLQWNKNS